VGEWVREEALQIGEGTEAVELGRGDQTVEDRVPAAALVAGGEEPVLPADGDPAQRSLGGVVVDCEVAVLGVAPQGLPPEPSIAEGLSVMPSSA
jgi:hypothetical protein